jgi:transcriptional regulator with XRE-family HTH domain
MTARSPADAAVVDRKEVDPRLRLFGMRVRQERERRGWSMRRLAEAAAVGHRQVARVEAGLGSPSVLWLVAVADALDVAPADLLVDFIES